MDLSLLHFSDLQHIIGARFCLLLFLIVGVFLIYKKQKAWIFLLVTGLLSAASYLIFVDDLPLMFWGLQGDEVTIAAMYNTFAHVSFFSDFAYNNLPPFYPPLFFWIFALPGRLLDWNGVQMAKIASAFSMAVFPLLAYGVQKWYHKVTPDHENKNFLPSNIAFFLAPLFVLLFIDWDAFILKPYEVIAAFLSVLWTVYFGLDLLAKRLTWKRLVVYGVAGGFLFLTYYLWLVFGAIALALFGLSIQKQNQGYYYSRIFFVGVIMLTVASPYLVPLIISYSKFGSQNFQIAYFVFQNAKFQAVMFEFFSWRGFLMLGGFVTLLIFRHLTYIRLLIAFLLSSYLWYFIGLTSLFFFAASNQEFKGFYYIDRTILAFAAAYGLEKLWKYAETKNFTYEWKKPALLLGLFFLSTQMIFGFFLNDPVVLHRRTASSQLDGEIFSLSTFIKQNPLPENTMTLQSGIPQLLAFAPVNNFLYYNVHNSHPAATFSKREDWVVALRYAKTPEEFLKLSQNSPYGSIYRCVFYKNNAEEYELYYNGDNFPQGGTSKIMRLPKKNFVEPGFKKVYENNKFIVFDVRTTP